MRACTCPRKVIVIEKTCPILDLGSFWLRLPSKVIHSFLLQLEESSTCLPAYPSTCSPPSVPGPPFFLSLHVFHDTLPFLLSSSSSILSFASSTSFPSSPRLPLSATRPDHHEPSVVSSPLVALNRCPHRKEPALAIWLLSQRPAHAAKQHQTVSQLPSSTPALRPLVANMPQVRGLGAGMPRVWQGLRLDTRH